MFLRFMRLDANYFSFLSGIFASAGINLLTGVLSSDQFPSRWPFLIASACLMVFASIALAFLTWELAAIQRLAIAEAPGFVDSDAAWTKVANTKRRRLALSSGVAAVCVILGMFPLFLGYHQITEKPRNPHGIQKGHTRSVPDAGTEPTVTPCPSGKEIRNGHTSDHTAN